MSELSLSSIVGNVGAGRMNERQAGQSPILKPQQIGMRVSIEGHPPKTAAEVEEGHWVRDSRVRPSPAAGKESLLGGRMRQQLIGWKKNSG